MKHRNDLPWRASQGEPRHGGRVSTVSSSIEAQNPYSILAAKRSESKAYACALAVPWLTVRPVVHPIAHTAKSPVTLDDCKTEKYNRIANEFNILI